MKKNIIFALFIVFALNLHASKVRKDQKAILKNMGFKVYRDVGKKKENTKKTNENTKKSIKKDKIDYSTQDASIIGPTGYLLVPNWKVLKENTANAAIHIYYPTSNNTTKMAKILKFNYSPIKNLEIGAAKFFTDLPNLSSLDPYFSVKYSFAGNFCAGAIFDASSQNDDAYYKNSYYGVYGFSKKKISLTIGGGINTGKSNAFAHFGDADATDSDKGFVIAGADFKLTDDMKLVMDFNGDRYSYGLRFQKKNYYFDIAMIQEGDNLALLPIDNNHDTIFGTGFNF